MAEMAYRSPVTKLLKFFRKSRDQWKEKCKQAKKKLKLLKLRLAKLQTSRDRWKEKARQLQLELTQRSQADSEQAKNEPTGPRRRRNDAA